MRILTSILSSRSPLAGLAIAVYTAGCASTIPSSSPSEGWSTYRTEAGFSFRAPADLEPQPAQPIDSQVGIYTSATLELVYDYGRYADPLLDTDLEDYRAEQVIVDGRQARLVSYEGGAGIHFPQLEGGLSLTVSVRLKVSRTTAEASVILRSIHFE